MSDASRFSRWRLVLGTGSEDALGDGVAEGDAAMAECLDFLYGREYGEDRNTRMRKGSLDPSNLTVADWINKIHELFPKKTIERLEKDALERYELEEMVTNPEVLQKVQPNQALLGAILRTKHLMNQQVLAAARRVVRKVVEELLQKLARPVRSPFIGTIDPRHRSPVKVARNFDAKTTLRRNLKNWDPKEKKLYLETPYFFSRVRRHVDKWQVIIVVDQSGSMLDSVIHSAITASIFFQIRHLRTHLVVFDTSVVDLTEHCNDPVEMLMKTQLGGGTDIGQALSYAAGLVDNPRRTIVVLITDFYEGGSVGRLMSVTKRLLESGVTLLGLAALDVHAHPDYDRNIAGRMVAMGARVGAMTPSELANWVAEKVE